MKKYFNSAEIRPSGDRIAYSSGIITAEDDVEVEQVFNDLIHRLADHYEVETDKVTIRTFNAV